MALTLLLISLPTLSHPDRPPSAASFPVWIPRHIGRLTLRPASVTGTGQDLLQLRSLSIDKSPDPLQDQVVEAAVLREGESPEQLVLLLRDPQGERLEVTFAFRHHDTML